MEDLLKSLAPFSTPLNLVLLAGLAALSRDRSQLVLALESCRRELIVEKDKRAEMLEKLYQEFIERGEAIVRAITDFNQRVDKVFRGQG